MLGLVLVVLLASGSGGGGPSEVGSGPPGVASPLPSGRPRASCKGRACHEGIHKIRHVVIIMQENRSFDSYFGTYPGADGIPTQDGVPAVCLPDPAINSCVRPYHDLNDRNAGGPHGFTNSAADVNGGKMDGFIDQAESGGVCAPNDPSCGRLCHKGERSCTDVVGYHTGAEIPNYWSYARDFVLQDHMFEPVSSWSLPAHLYEVSGWSAYCPVRGDPASCVNDPVTSGLPKDFGTAAAVRRRSHLPGPYYGWTDLTYLLHRYGVSWRYYVMGGGEPDCPIDSEVSCPFVSQSADTPGIWNPLPHFATVRGDRQLHNIQPLHNFFRAAHSGKLPAVSWVMPNDRVSEHPPALVTVGETYVTNLINTIMRSRDWSSTAIFLSWDDWGGFYDHVVPPQMDGNGYGIRVPGLVISPYAKQGFIDHQTLSHDAYLKFIEDDFLHGVRLDPRTDGRPDARPDVRENVPELGNLMNDFNFNQAPRPPMLLPLHPQTDVICPPKLFVNLRKKVLQATSNDPGPRRRRRALRRLKRIARRVRATAC